MRDLRDKGDKRDLPFRDARESREAVTRGGRESPLKEGRDVREPLGEPGETAAMRVPPRSRWQVLLMEYEMLDAYWIHLHQRVWSGGLVLVGLSMIGIAYMAVGIDPRNEFTAEVMGLVAAVAALLSVGWWFLLRRLHGMQRVAEYRKREIERELGMRQELYLAFLRQSRMFRRGSTLAQRMAEGDPDLTKDLQQFAKSSEAKPWLPRLMGERLVWSLVPWLLIGAWAGLYYLKVILD